jgi:hypothetical protein
MRYLVVSESSEDEPGGRVPIVATSDERLIGAFVDLLARRLGAPRPPRPAITPLPRPPGPPTGKEPG